MELLFLGTGGSVPTPDRNTMALALRNGQHMLLFDCGEGTQRQFMRSRFSFMRLDRVFITHMHGDHFLGVLGLVQSMNFSGRERPLELFGPKGIEDVARQSVMLGHFELCFPLYWRELVPGDVVHGDGYSVTAVPTSHLPHSLGYVYEEDERPGRFDPQKAKEMGVPEGPMFSRLQDGRPVVVEGRTITPDQVMGPPRKGMKMAYSGDTLPDKRFIQAAKGSDAMVHEATTDSSLQEKANQYMHSTARQAAEAASQAEARRLFLVHISGRYEDTSSLLNEAREVFPESYLPNDLDLVEIKRQ
ncbi:MAG: Ribonuclease Z [Methanomassiliicoccales archaeon PtaU1.Bin124]|nr:MAG: Ribonuclease Z [Methanomassiliicoccales archaeon PtaU1.Bin124]